MSNLYNDKPLLEIYYEVWLKPAGHWVLADGGRRRHKPDLSNYSYPTKLVVVEETSWVVEENIRPSTRGGWYRYKPYPALRGSPAS